MFSLYKRLNVIALSTLMLATPMASCSKKKPSKGVAAVPTAAPVAPTAEEQAAAAAKTAPKTVGDYLGDKTLERCRYFDGEQKIIEKITGGPPIAINISNFLAGKVATESTYRFDFIAYKAWDQEVWTMDFDGLPGKVPYKYTAYITEATTAYCKIEAAVDYTDLRTRLGCFADSTKIRMASGADKLIGLIQKDEMVLNPITQMGLKVVEIIKGPEHNPMYDIIMGSQKVTVTQNHPFMTKSGIKAAKDLVGDDELLGADGNFYALQGETKLPLVDGQVVYNIRLEGESENPLDHMVLANQVVTGDLFLQRLLEAK